MVHVRRLLVRVTLVVASAAATIAAAEAVLYAFDRSRPVVRGYAVDHAPRASQNFTVDPTTGWRMRPDHSFQWVIDGVAATYRADADGFRTGRASAGDDSPLMVTVGDSFAFGTGVEAEGTFGWHAASALGYRLRNLAMPGFGVDQIHLSALHQALPMKPDLLLIAIYPEDLERCFSTFRVEEGFRKPAFVIDDGTLRMRTPEDDPPAWWRAIERRSRCVGAWRRVERRVGRTRGIGPWWGLNRRILEATLDGCSGVRAVFLLVPSRHWTPFPALDAFMADRGARYLNPINDPEFDPEGAYFEVDSHLNAVGHERLGRWIAARLRDP